MPVTAPSSIKCPKCGQSLPGWSAQCQFCGSPLGNNVARPADAYKYQISNKKTWQEVVYTILAILMILGGAYKVAMGFGVFDTGFVSIGGGGFIGVFGFVQGILGVGLLTEQIWAQFLVKLCCWLMIPINLYLLLMVASFSRPGHVLVPAILQVWEVAFWSLQLYVINVVGDA